jgi:hypothetical protein
VLRTALFSLLFVPLAAAAQASLADGFSKVPPGASIVLMPADIELFEISAGGVIEPRADWTARAARHVGQGLRARHGQWKDFSDDGDESIASVLRLHRAVSQAVMTHHFGSLKLPTKEGRLEWSLGDDVAPLRERTGADYALFAWIRDTYASDARKLFGLGLGGGVQSAHASLVDLRSGRVVWFNRLRRLSGDLRQSAAAAETVDALLAGFPQ